MEINGDVVHVQDVCEVIVKIIKLDRKLINGQIFNIASFNHTLSEIGRKFQNFPKIKVNILDRILIREIIEFQQKSKNQF